MVLLGVLLLGGAVLAQSSSAAAQVPVSSFKTTPPLPLTQAEKNSLQTLFTKLRPATLRIEECEAKNCLAPDGIGTGFLIGEGGLALTAYHVVFKAQNLTARTSDGKKYAVNVIGYDDQNDLAVLKVNVPRNTVFLPLASAAPKVGEAVLAIGNGGGSYLSAKTGRLLALNSEASRADFPPGTLKLAAPLIPGDSGGPIINARGEVTGVVSFISVKQAQSQDELRGISEQELLSRITAYAVPVTSGDKRLTELKNGAKREAPVIGVQITNQFTLLTELPEAMFAEANRELNLQLGNTPGAFFNAVSPGSPAAKAGLQPLRYDNKGKRVQGDIVTAVNGKRIVNFSEFQFAVRAFSPGDTVTLSVLRNNKPLTLKMTLVGRSTVDN